MLDGKVDMHDLHSKPLTCFQVLQTSCPIIGTLWEQTATWSASKRDWNYGKHPNIS